jgi:hypothetical protein
MLFTCVKFPWVRVKIGSGEDALKKDGTLKTLTHARNIQFTQGSFITEDVEVIELLLNHPSYNKDFYGPFSRTQVADGSYKKELSKHIKKNTTDDVVPDMEDLAKKAREQAARTAPSISNRPLNDAKEGNVGAPTVVPVGNPPKAEVK